MFTNIFAPELTRQRYSFALRRMQMVLIDIKMHHQLTHYLIEDIGFAPIFPDTCYHLTHYWLAAVDIPV
ncbi:hypothetical protein, partial [Escherichia coli]|uniref:hypothetical protein n=1 Tax=Escherichia coli TaxID=562 RepID=UPI001BC85802